MKLDSDGPRLGVVGVRASFDNDLAMRVAELAATDPITFGLHNHDI
jgi:hypothetical protein